MGPSGERKDLPIFVKFKTAWVLIELEEQILEVYQKIVEVLVFVQIAADRASNCLMDAIVPDGEGTDSVALALMFRASIRRSRWKPSLVQGDACIRRDGANGVGSHGEVGFESSRIVGGQETCHRKLTCSSLGAPSQSACVANSKGQ